MKRSFAAERMAVAQDLALPTEAAVGRTYTHVIRDAAQPRRDWQDVGQVSRATVVTIVREDEHRTPSALFVTAYRIEIGKPDFAPLQVSHPSARS